jgi:hypothetical protein
MSPIDWNVGEREGGPVGAMGIIFEIAESRSHVVESVSDFEEPRSQVEEAWSLAKLSLALARLGCRARAER